VDLLYNGGIGTYIKASTEENSQVGDRANDRVRVNAKDDQARVVAEGGNLGCTQRGRLEYWSAGGLINTDAVDNSGGVDMSDHEVNIKILLDMLVKRGVIKGRDERNRILAEMTEEVAALVLADNENQARAITLDVRRSAAKYEDFVAVVDNMVSRGIVNRADEAIPKRDELLASSQRERGLARPLLAVLLGYSKMWGFQQVMKTDLPDSTLAEIFLDGYFPNRLRREYASYFKDHTLRREIVATGAINYAINNGGIALLPRLMGAGKTGIGEAIAAYLRVDRESGAEAVRQEILGAGLEASAEHDLLVEVESLIEAATGNLLTGAGPYEPAKLLARIRSRIAPSPVS
jgi:glutamate dehydrogenase